VPTKVELYGKTAGQINREICEANGQFAALNTINSLDSSRINQALNKSPASIKAPKIMYGNNSRESTTWVGGPTYEI
jgi:hypothetical protein